MSENVLLFKCTENMDMNAGSGDGDYADFTYSSFGVLRGAKQLAMAREIHDRKRGRKYANMESTYFRYIVDIDVNCQLHLSKCIHETGQITLLLNNFKLLTLPCASDWKIYFLIRIKERIPSCSEVIC